LTAILLVGGLGVEDQPSGLPEVLIYYVWFTFMGFRQRGRTSIETKNARWPDTTKPRHSRCTSWLEPVLQVAEASANFWGLS
jgi:hypothetical protein